MAAKTNSKSDLNSKIIRQISQLPHNKNCFDCGQKGPTYVNETIGAFVCTSCSGLLRGLNPAHRIKSISMGTFNDEEVRFIQLRGNAYCKNIWLWNYDPQVGPRPPETRDDQKMKDFLTVKYEKKRWYNASNEIHIADQLKSDDGSARSLGDLTNSGLMRKASGSSQKSFHALDSYGRSSASPNASVGSGGNQRSSSGGSIGLPKSHTSSAVLHVGNSVQSASHSGNADMNHVLDLFGSVSVSSPPTASTTPSHNGSASASSNTFGMDDWANFGHSQPQSQSTSHFPATFQSPTAHPPPQQPLSQSATAFSQPVAVKPLQPAFTPLTPQQASTNGNKSKAISSAPANVQSANPGPANTNQSSGDKYAALAELDEIMHATKAPPAVTNHSDGPFSTSQWGAASVPSTQPAKSPFGLPATAEPVSAFAAPFGTGPSAFHPVAAGAYAAPVAGNVWNDVFHAQPVPSAYSPGVAAGFDQTAASWTSNPFAFQNPPAAATVTNPFLAAAPVAPASVAARPGIGVAGGQPRPPAQSTNPFL